MRPCESTSLLLVAIWSLTLLLSSDGKGLKPQPKRGPSSSAIIRGLVNIGLIGGNDANLFENIFLEKFGYLDITPGHKHASEVLLNAVREFQRFSGITVTGQLDTTTLDKMKQPRCALPDVVQPGRRSSKVRGTNNSPFAYYVPGDRWYKKELTYKVLSLSRRLPPAQQMSAFSNALKKWSDVIPLTFRQVTQGNADIEIDFARRDHGDGPDNAFDGIGGILAHAFFPGQDAISGDTHFDADENWTLGTPRGTNLEIVAAHEFGHALGLGHSENPRALMAASYRYIEKYSLHRDDIQGAQKLYGIRNLITTIKPKTARTTKSAVRATTATPRTTQTPPTTALPDHCCAVLFDAAEQVHDGSIHIFRGAYVYTMTSQGPFLKRPLKSLYPGAPATPAAVVYDKQSRHTFIFKGTQYWRYTGYKKDFGYPRALPSTFHNAHAALQADNGQIYLLKDKKYLAWSERIKRSNIGYPRQISVLSGVLPSNVDAAFRGNNGHYYALKDQKYWIFNTQGQLARGFPKTINPTLLHCECGAKKLIKNTQHSYIRSNFQDDITF